MLGTDELNAYLNKYHLELDPQLDALVGRYYIAIAICKGRALFYYQPSDISSSAMHDLFSL